MKKKVFESLSFLERKLIGTAGLRSTFHMENRRAIKKLLVSTGATPGVDKFLCRKNTKVHLREMMTSTKEL